MIVGIDLGTTNSLIGVWQDGQAKLIPNALGSVLTPSAVSIDEDGSILVGSAAKERLVSHPERSIAAFKRYIGSNKRFSLGTHRFSPEELSALVLRSLREDAEAALGEAVHDAVITVPAYFNDHQRKATRLAAEMAGLNVRRLLNEPTAAAMAYGLHEGDDERQFLVLDLGGGTFDVTLLDMFAGVMEVRASSGDNMLGGEDFTRALIDGFIAHQSQPTDYWLKHDGLLYNAAEQAKYRLNGKEVEADMQVHIDGTTYNYPITRKDLTTLCEPLIQRIRRPIEQTVRDARLRLSQLDDIVLVGGASRMGIFRETITLMMGRFPSAKINPDETIAIGAAIQAGLVARDAALDDIVMTDVAPYTLGVETTFQIDEYNLQHGMMAPIIERNTVIPASREKSFSPVDKEQRAVVFNIYQGEAPHVRDNIFLDKISVDLPKGKADARDIDLRVRFTYDVSGLLEVDINSGDGKQHSLVIHNQQHVLNEDEINAIRDKLAALKTHPRDRAESRALIARAERIYCQHLGRERETIAYALAHYEQALEQQDDADIRRAAQSLLKVLDGLDHDGWQN